ncbi:MAG TPA: hypothetical protein VFP12_16320 [Allosphingosinicella sp.]|nr:hypothetical protein [Allosphingosinicella sp.]
MSLDIPRDFTFTIGLGLDISGIPTNYGIGITTLPKINMGFDPIKIGFDPIEIKPLDLSFRIKEIPSVRVHLPMDYKVCLALFGAELASIRLCGQGQVITEPYVANPCECRAVRQGSIAIARDDVEAAVPVG